MSDASDEPSSGLRPSDVELLRRLGSGNEWLRSVLCTLARRGTRLRLAEPARATALIDALQVWPWFKGGQFLFDLMEWEDFMVDGPPPPHLASVLSPQSWQRLDELLDRLRGLVDEAISPTLRVPGAASLEFVDEALPPLEPGMHLYRDVVLGVIDSIPPVTEPG